MRPKAFRRSFLAAAMVGGVAATALPQIPIPVPVPLPGLDVRITTGRPPAPRYERRVAPPGPDYVWVDGFWNWDGARWVWIPGRWERPYAREGYWIPPRYVRTNRGYIYEPGHWSNQTVVVGEDVRRRAEWRKHEREHKRELQREHDRSYYERNRRDRDSDRDHR